MVWKFLAIVTRLWIVSVAKPDCTGQKFGYLTVLGKAEIIKDRGKKSRRLWLLECVCGQKIKVPRESFDRLSGGQKSCGCMKYAHSNHRFNPQQLSGKRFGNLVAIAVIPGKRISPSDRSKVWLCQCDCGRRAKKSTKKLNSGVGLHCGERNLFHIPYANYPVAPIPYPPEAGKLVVKYLYLTTAKIWDRLQWGDLSKSKNNFTAEVEDERRDRLIRAAWIITYRRWNGESIGFLEEKRFIFKHLAHCQTDVYWRHKLHAGGGVAYNCLGIPIARRK